MNHYQKDSEPAGVVEFKLTSFEFKPTARRAKISWSRSIELDLEQFTPSADEISRRFSEKLDQMLWQLKIDSVLKAADDREVAYRKRVDLFLKQTEERKQ